MPVCKGTIAVSPFADQVRAGIRLVVIREEEEHLDRRAGRTCRTCRGGPARVVRGEDVILPQVESRRGCRDVRDRHGGDRRDYPPPACHAWSLLIPMSTQLLYRSARRASYNLRPPSEAPQPLGDGCSRVMDTTVVSHYRLLHPLGEGGMGIVYRAEDLQLGREVAIKLLRVETVASQEWLARFEREARLASSLQPPNICTIHELGEHDNSPFIVMERLEGRTIKQLVESGPLPPRQVLGFARQIADALDAAHRRGIIHRDIKPANLFVTHGDR